MLIVVQLPLTDVRPFLDADSRQIAAKVWPILTVSDDEPDRAPFVRAFGRARRRPKGGLDEWPAEDAYCDGAHSLRLVRSVRRSIGVSDESKAYCAFRRLYWDGKFQQNGAVVGRIEIGFGLKRPAGAKAFPPEKFGRIVDALLTQEVRIPVASDIRAGAAGSLFSTTTLAEAGPGIARAYLRASTRKDGLPLPADHDWWVQAGSPQVIVEYSGRDEVDAVPGNVQPIALSGELFDGIRVFIGRRQVKGKTRPVWFFEGGASRSERDALRRLRLNVTRLHAALSTFQLLTDLHAKGRLSPATPEANRRLSDCLSAYLPLLYQKEYHGFAWTDFLRAALTLSDVMAPGRMATLRAVHPAPGRGLRSQFDRAEVTMAKLASETPPPIEYEIFLAHAGTDLPFAEQLYTLLAKPDVRVFLDKRSLFPSDTWDVEIQQAQRASRMTVVLVGPKWEQAFFLRSEVQTAISLFRLDAQRHRVLSVFLPGSGPDNAPYGLNLPQGISVASVADLPDVATQILGRLMPLGPTVAFPPTGLHEAQLSDLPAPQ